MNFYIDPKSADLIIYDPEEKEIRVIKVIEETEYEEWRGTERPPEEKKPRKTGRKPRKEKPEREKPKHRRSCKTDDETIEKIRSMKKEGRKTREISAELGVSASVVYKYTRGMEKPEGSVSEPKPSPQDPGGFKSFSGEKSQEENEGALED